MRNSVFILLFSVLSLFISLIAMATSYYNQMPLATSPAINAGHSELSATIDFTGALREGIADIGAFENTVVSIPADQNHAQSLALNIFPNPVTENVTVNAVWNQPEEVTIDLYTVYGKKLIHIIHKAKHNRFNMFFRFMTSNRAFLFWFLKWVTLVL